MNKNQVDIVKVHILRRFLRKTIIGMRYVNRHDIQVKKIGGDIVQKAIEELIKDGYLETHKNKQCISINSKLLKSISEYLEKS